MKAGRVVTVVTLGVSLRCARHLCRGAAATRGDRDRDDDQHDHAGQCRNRDPPTAATELTFARAAQAASLYLLQLHGGFECIEEGLSGMEAKRSLMLRRHLPEIDPRPLEHVAGLEHLPPEPVAVLRWLAQSRVEYVVVGAVGRAIRGDAAASGPPAVAPAPYGRNLERLARTLNAAHARLRNQAPATSENAAIKMTAEKLAVPRRWLLRCGSYDLDIEGQAAGLPDYQELLYEAASFEIERGFKVEVASAADIEHFEHLKRVDEEIRITRKQREPA